MAKTVCIMVRFENDEDAQEATLADCEELSSLFYGISDGQVKGRVVSCKIVDSEEPVDLQELIDADEDGPSFAELQERYAEAYNKNADCIDPGNPAPGSEFETCFLPKLGTLEFARPGRPKTVGELRAMLRNVPDSFRLEVYSERMDSAVDFSVDREPCTETITFYTEN